MIYYGNSDPWPDHEVEALRKLWAEGKSAADISKIIPGRSRSAVVAKVHRMGWSGPGATERLSRREPSAPPVKRNRATGGIKIDKPAPSSSFGRFAPSSPAEAAKKRAHFTEKGAGIIKGFAEAANDTSVLLIERRRFQCSWPVGEVSGAGQMCCGQPVDPSATRATESYCPSHRKRAVGMVLPASKAFGCGERRQAQRSDSTPWDQGRAA